jgi:predicted dehydrogenase
MDEEPRVVVLGSGWAGIGHALAFRLAGAQVVGMASRTASAVQKSAESLSIPSWSTDWRSMITDLRPDVVAVATPGGPHLEMCEAAIESGCHVYCDKPLATTADEARHIYEASLRKGVKTAYAEACRYQPQLLFARELVQRGAIGRIREAECIGHLGWPPLLPFNWVHQLEQGGGRLNCGLPHALSILQYVIGGEPLAVMGEARNDVRRAPIGKALHFPDWLSGALTPEDAGSAEWAEVDADMSFTALVRLGVPGADFDDAATAYIRHSAIAMGKSDYAAFYGEQGTIHIEEQLATGRLYLKRFEDKEWAELPLPPAIIAAVPQCDRNTIRNWAALAIDLLADIRGDGHSGYQTFRDGWIYQEIIEAIRAGHGWTSLDISSATVAH